MQAAILYRVFADEAAYEGEPDSEDFYRNLQNQVEEEAAHCSLGMKRHAACGGDPAPRSSQTSKQLEQELKLTTERLGHLAGTELDEQWANAQIEQHQAALMKQRELRRTTETPELRTHIDGLVQMVEHELRRVAALRAVLALAGGHH